jgi:alcohol dehydrogenase class IV
MAGLAHSLGHALGGVFHTPHGRAVGLFLPYTIEYAARENPQRYAEVARHLGISSGSEEQAAASLVQAVRDLLERLEQPTTLAQLGIERHVLMERSDKLLDNAANEATTVVHPRIASHEDLERLLLCAYEGRAVGF